MSGPTDTLHARNIVLIGFMGCGKSTVGHRLHQELHYPLLDSDHVIEEAEGRAISDIFAEDGEGYFRELETQFLRSQIEEGIQHHVVATGGGLPVREENRELLRKLGFVVWLDATPETIFDRVSRNQKRPLLQTENPRATIDRMLEERTPIYRETAHLRINTSDLEFSEITYGITESARVFFSAPQEA